MHQPGGPALVLELDVGQLDVSIDFYDLLGFTLSYTRPEEGFACLVRGGVRIMLQAADGPGRRFRTAQLRRPFGRGLSFQLEVEDLHAIYDKVLRAGYRPLVDLEEHWYRVDDWEVGHRQFVLADPDGYLWRPFENLGTRRR